MTNADCIRQMTDDELYRFLQAFEIGDIDYSLTFCSLCKEDNQLDCDECFRRWLFGDASDYNGLLADKGINSGYADRKTEPQTSCKTCRYGEVDEGYVRCAYYSKSTEQDEPQTEVGIAKALIHKAIDESDIADEAYPNLRQRLHDVVGEYEPQTERSE